MITYPVLPTLRFALLQVSTSEIIKRDSPWPTTGGPIKGLDPDLRWLEQKETPPQPYDVRLFFAERLEEIRLGEEALRITYAIKPQPITERRQHAIRTAQEQFQRHVALGEVEALTVWALAALLRGIKDKTLTDAEKVLRARLMHLSDVAAVNDARLCEILKAMERGDEPDLDKGWADPLPC